MIDLSTEALKVNLGYGSEPMQGYCNLDAKDGDEIYPLAIDGRCHEVRASHVLEHFPHGQVVDIIADWAKALIPGGDLKIAVPDFEWIAKHYLAGKDINVQGYLMGGQVDGLDFHKSAFDEELLAELMRQAGLIDIQRWQSDVKDCAALPVSLNLKGTKPLQPVPAADLTIRAVMSVPRLGFDANFACAHAALPELGIKLYKFTGAFWEQCIERGFEDAIAAGVDAVLAIDYDTLYTAADVAALKLLLREHPEADAVAPLQSARWRPEPLLTFDKLPVGVKSHDRIPPGVFVGPLTELRSAHFGCTLIRTAALKKMKKPWFWSQPDPNGAWGDARRDADCTFWDRFREAGCRVFSANRIAVGHMELMALWPGPDFAVVSQPVSDFMANGKPQGIWQ